MIPRLVLFPEESMRVVRFAVIAVMSALVVVWSRPVATGPQPFPVISSF